MLKKNVFVFTLLFVLSLYLTHADAATLNVPSGSYPTIQSAIDAAFDGDVIEVSPGTYESITFPDKGITVESTGLGVARITGTTP
ncbi:hypothetical protein ACFL1E_07815, partial [Candidatus Omnitrophota bacterium]